MELPKSALSGFESIDAFFTFFLFFSLLKSDVVWDAVLTQYNVMWSSIFINIVQ